MKLGDKGFLSRDISVLRLAVESERRAPRFSEEHLKAKGLSRGRYNQIANFVLAQAEINIAIGKKRPPSIWLNWASSVRAGPGSTGESPRWLPSAGTWRALPAGVAD